MTQIQNVIREAGKKFCYTCNKNTDHLDQIWKDGFIHTICADCHELKLSNDSYKWMKSHITNTASDEVKLIFD